MHNSNVIANRRRQDNARAEMDHSIAVGKKVLQIANFENKTASKIEHKNKEVTFVSHLFLKIDARFTTIVLK